MTERSEQKAQTGSRATTGYPSWWPENPYPADVFPMTVDDYVHAVPDENQRTALSGCLGRLFWGIASASIRDAWILEQAGEFTVQELEEVIRHCKIGEAPDDVLMIFDAVNQYD